MSGPGDRDRYDRPDEEYQRERRGDPIAPVRIPIATSAEEGTGPPREWIDRVVDALLDLDYLFRERGSDEKLLAITVTPRALVDITREAGPHARYAAASPLDSGTTINMLAGIQIMVPDKTKR